MEPRVFGAWLTATHFYHEKHQQLLLYQLKVFEIEYQEFHETVFNFLKKKSHWKWRKNTAQRHKPNMIRNYYILIEIIARKQ